jgi:hypothetical protein
MLAQYFVIAIPQLTVSLDNRAAFVQKKCDLALLP